MKIQDKILSILLCLIVLFTIIPISCANPVFVEIIYSDALPKTLVFSFLMINLTIVIESITLYLFFINKIRDHSNFFIAVSGVNLITFPATQLLAFFVFTQFLVVNIWNYVLIELLPIFVESILYLSIFKEVLSGELRKSMTFISTIIANLLTFLIGTYFFIQFIQSSSYFYLG
jgi:hypothetical protein